MKKTIITLYAVLVVIILVMGGIFALWYKGGSEISSHLIDINTGKPLPSGPRLFYRGIRIPMMGETLVLLKRYYTIVWKDPYTDLNTTVSYKQNGYNQFFMFYESGQIAAHGFCMVESCEPDGQIMYDNCDVKDAQYYEPDGTEVSIVKDGTGIILLHFSDGSKYWELELENFQRKKLKMWLKDGTLKLDEVYENPVNPVNPV